MAGAKTSVRILDAADEVLAEVGYDGASVGRVADRAGVKKALVFYHHGSKANLVGRVLERYYDAHRRALSDAFEAGGDVRERMHRVVDAYFAFMVEHRRFPRLVQAMIARGGEAQEMVQDNLRSLFRQTTEMLFEVTPRAGPLAARQFYQSFSGMVTSYFTYAPVLGADWGEDPLGTSALQDRLQHVHWMVDAVLDKLAGEPPR